MNAKKLLAFNQRGALSHLLAVEEHVQQLPPGVSGSWCAKKHSLLAVDHHLSEAVNHASRISPALADKYRAIKAKSEQILQPALAGALPDLGQVAKLRNAMRAVFNDPTLNEDCPVCSLDQNKGLGGIHPLHPRHPYANGTPALYGQDEPAASPLWILAGLGVVFWLTTSAFRR